VASLDSSGAIGGVLELPGDDYFIYGGGRAGAKGCMQGCLPERSNRFVSVFSV
jgi:hypothetical protein